MSDTRECETRSYATLMKSSMIQQTTQQIPARPELDLPQSGSKDDDETWLTEPTGCKTTTTPKVAAEAIIAAEAINAAEACSSAEDPFHPHPKTQPVAEPDLPRTQAPANSDHAKECDLPGPLSRDDDEDSSPLIKDLDLADHIPCSTRDMTTSGHDESTLTHSLGASALGSETTISENANLTDSNRKVTPASPPENAKLTL